MQKQIFVASTPYGPFRGTKTSYQSLMKYYNENEKPFEKLIKETNTILYGNNSKLSIDRITKTAKLNIQNKKKIKNK